MKNIEGLPENFADNAELYVKRMNSLINSLFLNNIRNTREPEKTVKAYVKSLILEVFEKDVFTYTLINNDKYYYYLNLYSRFCSENEDYINRQAEVILNMAGIKGE